MHLLQDKNNFSFFRACPLQSSGRAAPDSAFAPFLLSRCAIRNALRAPSVALTRLVQPSRKFLQKNPRIFMRGFLNSLNSHLVKIYPLITLLKIASPSSISSSLIVSGGKNRTTSAPAVQTQSPFLRHSTWISLGFTCGLI